MTASLASCSNSDTPIAQETSIATTIAVNTTTTTTTTTTTKPTSRTSASSLRATTSAVTSSTTAAYSTNTVRSVVITTDSAIGSGKNVGPDLYQLSGGGEANIDIAWASRGENGNVQSNECSVVLNVTGPGGLDERRRSNRCSDRLNWDYVKVGTPGTFTINIALTPPPGSGAVMNVTKTFDVIGYGN